MEYFKRLLSRKVLILALFLTLIANVLIQLLQVYKYSYDAYTHIFFADHYRRDWFSLWDTRWYGGFPVTTYPPLSHHLIAILSQILKIELSYQVMSIFSAIALTYSIYLFSKIFLEDYSAQYAALIASFLPSAGIMLNTFGQLPTVISTAFSLIAAYKFNIYLSKGSRLSFLQAVLWTAVSGFTHHVTLVFFTPLLILLVMVKEARLGYSLIKKTLLYTIFSLTILVTVMYPFIEYVFNHPGWAEIPHATRYNIFSNPTYSFPFFWAMYSFTIFLLPNAIVIVLRRRNLFPLLILFLLLFVIGLGGTTSLPEKVFGSLWHILTYDKFSFWATVLYTPFLATMVSNLGAFIEKYYYGNPQPIVDGRIRNLLLALTFFGLITSFTLSSTATVLMGLQPVQELDGSQLNALAKFLDSNSGWKYITLGFGGQRILLSSMTIAPMFDGGYNQAKMQEIFTESGVESVDGAKYFSKGLSFLKKVILEESGNGLKYVLSADEYYTPILRDFGLKPIMELEGARNVKVWEIPYAVEGVIQSTPNGNMFTKIMWSLAPITCLATALLSEFKIIIDSCLMK